MDCGDCGTKRSHFHSRTFYSRIPLLICAIIIFLSVLYKSRPGRETSAPAAFPLHVSSSRYVRIIGDVRYPGIYPYSANIMTIDAIKMAGLLVPSISGLNAAQAASFLNNGDELRVIVHTDGTLQLTKSIMKASARLVMGVPLEINSMNEADFDRVPGIGPVMAKRIIEYRQINGGSMKVTDLINIEGIGENKYNKLLKYF